MQVIWLDRFRHMVFSQEAEVVRAHAFTKVRAIEESDAGDSAGSDGKRWHQREGFGAAHTGVSPRWQMPDMNVVPQFLARSCVQFHPFSLWTRDVCKGALKGMALQAMTRMRRWA